jgi:hypothetical protein
VNPGFEHQTLRVYQDVALSAFDLLAAIVSSLLSTHPCRFDRLAIHYGRARLGVPLGAYPYPLTQGGVHPLPRSIQTPEAEVVVDRFPAVGKSCGKSRQAQTLGTT